MRDLLATFASPALALALVNPHVHKGSSAQQTATCSMDGWKFVPEVAPWPLGATGQVSEAPMEGLWAHKPRGRPSPRSN